MQKVLDDLCDYRRYCWNAGLALWNELYEESLILDDKRLRPNEYKVRNELVANKADWQYRFSARCLQLAISDLNKAWKNFFDKAQVDWGKPRFKSKKAPRQGFKTDRAKIIKGKLRLDKPHGIKKWYDIRMSGVKSLTGELKVVSIYRENGKYWQVCLLKSKWQTKLKLVIKQPLTLMLDTSITLLVKLIPYPNV